MYPLHVREVDHQAIVANPQACRVVAAPSHRDEHADVPRKIPGGASRPSETYPPGHPVMLCRVLHLSLGQLRLLSEAMHDGWASQALLDHLDQSIKTIQDVEDVLREAKP